MLSSKIRPDQISLVLHGNVIFSLYDNTNTTSYTLFTVDCNYS